MLHIFSTINALYHIDLKLQKTKLIVSIWSYADKQVKANSNGLFLGEGKKHHWKMGFAVNLSKATENCRLFALLYYEQRSATKLILLDDFWVAEFE